MNGRINKHFARREFLKSVGLPAAAAPFLPLLNASGRERVFPKRLVLVFTPHGTIPDAWKPEGTETNFRLGPILKPLQRHKKDLNIIAGLEVRAPGVGAPHTKGPAILWTGSPLLSDKTFLREDAAGGLYYGWNSGPSIDQVIARTVGLTTPYRSIELGVRAGGNHPGSRMIYAGPRQPVPPESNPYAVLGRVFAAGGKTYEQLQQHRKSTNDVLKADLDSFRREAGADDREKLDAHLAAVRSIETRLEQKPVACRRAPRLPDQSLDPYAVENTPRVWELQQDLLVASLACDVTRVASLQYRIGENDSDRYTWLDIAHEGHHLITHSGDSNAVERANLTKIYTWYADRFARLLDGLASVKEGNGTLLDNTLVVWGSEIAKGNSHSFEGVPFVTAGGCGGVVRTGRFLEYPAKTPHNRFLVSLAHAMGVPGISTFGSTDTGSGPLERFSS